MAFVGVVLCILVVFCGSAVVCDSDPLMRTNTPPIEAVNSTNELGVTMKMFQDAQVCSNVSVIRCVDTLQVTQLGVYDYGGDGFSGNAVSEVKVCSFYYFVVHHC